MSELKIFNYQDNEIRTVQQGNETWWVLKDVCEVLGIQNTTDVARRLDSDEVVRFNLGGLSGETNIINESGLYNVILRSDKPAAKQFKRWVTHEVLPSIRKHGAYATPATLEAMLNDPDTMITTLQALKTEREEKKALQVQVAQRDQLIGELKPKADYVDWILNNPGLVTITQIAKDYGMSGQAMNRQLYELEIQYKQSGQWLLYRKHHGMGYTHSETIAFNRSDGREDTKMETKWTQKGRLFIYELLKEKAELLPVIERGRAA